MKGIRYTVKIYNTDTNRCVMLSINGLKETVINPMGVYEVSRNEGEYIITAQSEDLTSEVITIYHMFNKNNNGKIIPLVIRNENEQCSNVSVLKYRCFIAGSTKITNERNAARAVLSILYNQYEKYNFYITSHTYEDFNNKHKIDGQQMDYDSFIKEKADCTIFIICNCVGEQTIKEYESATETYELSGCRRPAIFVYNDISMIDHQDATILKFRKLVDSKRAYWRDYKGIDMLMLQIKDDIGAELTDVLEMRPSLVKTNSI